jgi:hypothetical protein
MASESHGRCTHCNVIWRWRSTKDTPKVTKGEAFCENYKEARAECFRVIHKAKPAG